MSHICANSYIYAFHDRGTFEDFYGTLSPQIKRDSTTVYVKRIGTSLVSSTDIKDDIDDMRSIKFYSCIIPIHHSFQYGEPYTKHDLINEFPNIDNDVLDRIWHEKITYQDCFEALDTLTKKYGRVALENLANFKFNPDDFPSLNVRDGWILEKFSSLRIHDNQDDGNNEDEENSDSDCDYCSDESNYDDINNDSYNSTESIEYNIVPLDGRKSYLDVLLTPKIDDDNVIVPNKLQTVVARQQWNPKIVVQPVSYKRKDRLYQEDVKLTRIDYDDDPDDEGIMDIIYSEMSMKGLKVRSRVGTNQITKDHRISVKKG